VQLRARASPTSPAAVRVPPTDPAVQRPAGRRRARDAERLNARLAAADEALQRERARRTATDQALEEQRAESQRLRAELGRLRAQLELAGAAQLEAESGAAELDGTRRLEASNVEMQRAARVESQRTPSAPPRSEAERPLNPSLRHRTNWLGRVVALLFMLLVIAAVVLVIRKSGLAL
jgi:hypothetical protein